MSILNFMITLIIVGFLLWLVNNYLPMDSKFKKILNIVVVIGVILWIVKVFSILKI